jgi:hypothetical protein
MSIAFLVEALTLPVGFMSIWYYLDVLDVNKREELGDQVGDVLRTVVRSNLCADSILTEDS